jgi:sugar-specific transcriptional regulator TrmB
MSNELEKLRKRNEELEKYYKNSEAAKEQTKSFSSEFDKANQRVSGSLGEWTLDIKQFSNSVENAIGDFGKALSPFDLKPFQVLDERATIIQKTFGTTKARLEEFKQTIADTTPELIKMGLTEEEALSNVKDLMSGLGTAASLGTEAITEISAASELSGVGVKELASSFREVGVSIYDVGDQMKEVTDYARSVGVSVAGVSAKVVGNLDKMNLYNFDNGIKGLAKMAATSERMGISMEQVFNFAEKIYDPEGAIEMAAGLQRLGVTASGLLDPLRAMDLAANDPEGLQKEILNVTKEFTKFNEANGKFEIMPGSKRRLREIAKEMGIPAEELASMSIKAADFDMKMKQIQFPSLATDQETKEMIAGMAQLKDGKAVINVKNEQTGKVELKQVDQLTATDLESLKKSQEESGLTIEEIARRQLSVSEQIAANTAGFIKTVEFGKATSEPLEKLYTSVMGFQQDATRNLAQSVTTGGVRGRYDALTQPVEDYVTGGISGDKSRQVTAEKNFVQALIDTEKSIREGSQQFIMSTMTDFSARLKETYNQPQKVETKSEINVNVNITGDENTRGMNATQIKTVVQESFANPEFSSAINGQLAGGNQPSATTGSKNKQP